jgi:hypothetical protein
MARPWKILFILLWALGGCRSLDHSSDVKDKAGPKFDEAYYKEALQWMKEDIYYKELIDVGIIRDPFKGGDFVPLVGQERDEALQKAQKKAEKKVKEREVYLRTRLMMTPEEIEILLKEGEMIDKEGNPLTYNHDDPELEWIRFRDANGRVLRGKPKFAATDMADDWIEDNLAGRGDEDDVSVEGLRARATYLFAHYHNHDIVPVYVVRNINGRDYHIRVRFEEENPLMLAEHRNLSKKMNKEMFTLIDDEGYVMHKDPSGSESFRRMDQQTSEVMAMIDFVTQQNDRNDRNWRMLPGMKPLFVDEELCFFGSPRLLDAAGSTGYDTISQKGLEAIQALSPALLAKASKDAGISKFRTKVAILQMLYLKAHPIILANAYEVAGEPPETDYNVIRSKISDDIVSLYVDRPDVMNQIEDALAEGGYTADYKYGEKTGDEAKKVLAALKFSRKFSGSCRIEFKPKLDASRATFQIKDFKVNSDSSPSSACAETIKKFKQFEKEHKITGVKTDDSSRAVWLHLESSKFDLFVFPQNYTFEPNAPLRIQLCDKSVKSINCYPDARLYGPSNDEE